MIQISDSGHCEGVQAMSSHMRYVEGEYVRRLLPKVEVNDWVNLMANICYKDAVSAVIYKGGGLNNLKILLYIYV